MNPSEIKTLIENGLDGATVEIFSEDNTHYAALYRCLGSLMGNEIHAMSIRAHTPDEWAAMQASAGE